MMDKEEKIRTLAQNRSVHKGFELISRQFRENNLSIQTVLEQGVELEWTPLLVKEILFKPIAKLMFGVDSTTKLTTHQLQEVWENMSRAIGGSGVYVAFPSVEEQMLKDLADNPPHYDFR